MGNFSNFVIEQFGRLQNKFRQKHTQYKGSDADELANFRAEALLKYGKADMAHMYETAKDYCRKHVAYIETHGIDGKTVEDSLEDIAVYAMIMLYMRKCSKQDAGNDQ